LWPRGAFATICCSSVENYALEVRAVLVEIISEGAYLGSLKQQAAWNAYNVCCLKPIHFKKTIA
jgi:hypothetical protein